MGTARTGITRGQQDLSRQLLFHIDVELLDSSLFEIRILRQDGPGKIGRVGRGGERRESGGHADSGGGQAARGAGGRGEGTSAAERKSIRFGIIGRILPQSLCALIPGRIVEDRIAAPNYRVASAEGLPRHANPRLQRRQIHLNAGARARVLTRNQELSRRSSTLAPRPTLTIMPSAPRWAKWSMIRASRTFDSGRIWPTHNSS